jgi:predicted small lipoprotein YifL
MRFFLRFLPAIAALALAAGCGQKGPLYLRDNPPPGVKPPKTDTYKPVPYPKEAPQERERGADQQ